MPLSDFVRYLNAQHPVHFSGDESAPSFVFKDGKVHAHYAGLRLESAFSPITSVAEGQPWGHSARVNVTRLRTHLPLKAEVLFTMPRDNTEFVYLDRLLRTLHVLNYLTYLNWQSRKTLLLKVHPRHVASVATDHGLAFENILRGCGLMPRQVVLAFELSRTTPREATLAAFESYRGRGYSIAIHRPDLEAIDAGLLAEIDPEIITLDGNAPDALQQIGRFKRLGAAILVRAADDDVTQTKVIDAGADLLQRRPITARLKHADGLDSNQGNRFLRVANMR